MVLNVLLWSGYALIILTLVNGTKGNVNDDILAYVKKLDAKLKGNIGNVNVMSGDVNSIKIIVNAMSDKVSSITGIVDKCPVSKGYFIAPGTGQGQCLKVFLDTQRTWPAARDKCRGEGKGLQLARPFNAIALRNYLFERYNTWHYWVDAQGNSKDMMWQTNRAGVELVRTDSPLWLSDQPPTNVTSSMCMAMTTHPGDIQKQPEKIYFAENCLAVGRAYALCELDLTKPSNA